MSIFRDSAKWWELRRTGIDGKGDGSPIQGSGFGGGVVPRALPWAIVFRPFGTKIPGVLVVDLEADGN